jgi:hypothetical protein
MMERYFVDEDRSYRYPVRTSTTRDVKLRQLAGDLVGEANQWRPRS